MDAGFQSRGSPSFRGGRSPALPRAPGCRARPELIGGVEHRTIVDYSAARPARFEQEQRRWASSTTTATGEVRAQGQQPGGVHDRGGAEPLHAPEHARAGQPGAMRPVHDLAGQRLAEIRQEDGEQRGAGQPLETLIGTANPSNESSRTIDDLMSSIYFDDMSEAGARGSQMVEAAGDPDPATGLAAVAALRGLVEVLEELQVDNARAQGWSWRDIARVLGVTKQAMHYKHAGRLRGRD